MERQFNMSFNCSSRSDPKVIPKVDEPERLLKCTDALKIFSYHTPRVSRYSLTQEAENMDSKTQALDYRDSQHPDNVKEYIEVEDGKLELYHERAQTTQYTTQLFVTRW